MRRTGSSRWCSSPPRRQHRVRHAGRAHQAVAVPDLRGRADRHSSTRSRAPGPGAAAGWPRRASADFAGSTIVHSVGGWAALSVGAMILGARARASTGPNGARAADAGREPAAGDPGHLHPVARLVRLQRRLAAGPGVSALDAAAMAIVYDQHQPGRSGRRGGGHGR